MTASAGGLSTAIIAVIVAGGIFGLLALITITAFICDLPKRMQRRKAAKEGKTAPVIDEVDAEKAAPTVSVTEVGSQRSQFTTSNQTTRAPSPECQCAHPNPMPRVTPPSPRF